MRLNALKHGLLSQAILLPREDAAALRELGEGVRAELQPVGQLENMLVEQITVGYWRLRRFAQVEAGIFIQEHLGELRERAESEVKSYERGILEYIVEDEDTTTITDEQKHREALAKARELQAKQYEETATLGKTFIRDANGANALSKLSRYETARERSLYRALHELQRLQAARRAEGTASHRP